MYVPQMAILVFFWLIFFEKDSFAYIDPGTGSFLFQVFAATAIGFVLFFKNTLNYFKSLLSGKKDNDTHDR